MVRKNRFTKALNHLKSTELDEKIQSLKEGPTNKTTGVYSLGKKGVSLSPYEPPKKFFPDKDGNWPEGVPGVPGEGVYVRPGGFWDGGRDWDSVQESDFSYNNMVDTNNNTSTEGLISPGGFVQTALPPNSRHFILGPLVDSYTYNHGYDSYTTIGYLQKDTRQFVALGRIWGQWKAGLHGSLDRPNRVWDPTNSSVFESYNPEFTLEMAQWVSAEANADRFYSDVPYFYSGGVMQSIPTWGMNFSNLWPTIGNLFGNMFGGLGFGGGGNGGSASTATPGGAGFGSGDPSVVSTGQQLDGDDPSNHGNSGDNNLWGMIGNLINSIKDTGVDIFNYIKDNPVQGGLELAHAGVNILRGVTDYHNFGSPEWIFKGLDSTVTYDPAFTGASNIKIPDWIPNWRGYGGGARIPAIKDWPVVGHILRPLIGSNYSTQYFTPDLATAINYAGDGGNIVAIPRPQQGLHGVKNWFGSVISRGFDPSKGVEQLVHTSHTIANQHLTQIANVTDPQAMGALQELTQQGIKNINKPLASIGRIVPFLNAGLVAADVTIRLNKKPPDYIGAAAGALQIIPGPVGWTALAAQLTYDIALGGSGSVTNSYLNQNVHNFLGGIHNGIMSSGDGLSGQSLGVPRNDGIYFNTPQGTANEGFTLSEGKNPFSDFDPSVLKEGMRQAMLENGMPEKKEDFVAQMIAYFTLTGMHPMMVQVMGIALLGGKLNKDQERWCEDNLGKMTTLLAAPKNTSKDLDPGNPINSDDDPWAIEKQQTLESVSEERKIQILKEIKKPVLIEATPMKKLSGYKPKFKSKSNTPPTKPQSAEQLVASGNAKGQAWREEDKHWQGYETTERLNIIRHQVGHGEAAWNQIIEDARRKNGWKNREMQEQLNIISHERALKGIDPDFESPFNLKEWQNTDHEDEINIISKDPLVKKVKNRLLSQIDYEDKPSRKGYPEQAPQKMVKGFHKDYGQKSGYYKKLDTVSALAMPKQGDEEIDAEVDKQKKKYVNPKVAESWKSDWRDSLTNA